MISYKKRSFQEVLDMLGREDYYKILKIRKNPNDYLSIRWNVMRSKYAILNTTGLLVICQID